MPCLSSTIGGRGPLARHVRARLVALACGGYWSLGCSASADSRVEDPSPSTNGGSSGIVIGLGGSTTGAPVGGDDDAWPSPACQGAAIASVTGQYCRGPSYTPAQHGGTIQNDSGCGTTLWGVARDFVGYMQTATNPAGAPHPDFGSHYCCGTPKGTVLPTLGVDDKPAYNPANIAGDYNVGVGLAGPEAFAQWYNDVPG